MRVLTGMFFEHLVGSSRPPNGVVAKVGMDLHRSMFTGLLWSDPSGNLVGSTVDHRGVAALSDIRLGEHEFKFTKTYFDRRTFHYVYDTKERDIWIGEYSGDNGGFSSCTIEVVDLLLLDFEQIRGARLAKIR